MKAFKMACVDYISRDVAFRGINFTRRMLFDIRRKIIDEEWKKLLSEKSMQQTVLVKEKGEDPVHAFYRMLDSKLHYAKTHFELPVSSTSLIPIKEVVFS
jgi:hypothetical protein